MNKKLKETLKHLFATQKINNGWTSFSEKECKELSNYITNLQQVNQELKYQIEYANKINNEAINRKNKYKSRIEKAVEYIKKIQQNAIKFGADHDVIICQELIDSLNGKE